jgi:hypothetical protein
MRRVRLLVCALLAATAQSIGISAAQVNDLSTEPILRIETGQHGAAIFRIDIDAANRFAVTASADKTARVWSLPDGKLLRILRVPIEDANDPDNGKLYSVAISPDGNTVAVGGWTALFHNDIFLFDRASGNLKRRFGDLPNVVNCLVYSPDGSRLAASLGANGVRVFDAMNDYSPLPSDTKYNNSSFGAQFDRAGRLVTVSDDGFVRLYAADNYAAPIARFDSRGRNPYSAAFSPDGSRIAVGFRTVNDVEVLSGSDLKQLFKANTAGVPNDALDGFMEAVGWSQDGRFLFAGGGWHVIDVWRVRRWSGGGRGAFVDIPVGASRLERILGLRDGSMLVADQEGFGLINPDAKVTRLQGLGSLSLNTGRGPLLDSEDGGTIQVDSWEPKHTYRFALERRVIEIDPPASSTLKAPITTARGVNVTNWRNSVEPNVNGTRIKLKTNELTYSIAIVPGTQHFALGASFSLRLIDQEGKDVWPKALAVPGPAWHVTASGDGRLVIVAYGGGTIRWHRVSDGGELLALFMHPDGQRWILWTPQGYYDASIGADELIGWHVNRGRDQAPEFYPVSQFRSRFHRPDVIQRVLQTLDVEEALRKADEAANRPIARTVPITSMLTPVIEINDPKTPAAVDRTDLQFGYSVRMPAPGDTLRVEVQIDGAKLEGAQDHPLVSDGSVRAGILHLKIPRRNSTIAVIAYNQNGAGQPATVQIEWRGPGAEPKPTLYVLAIGISNYQDKDPKIPLQFAAEDAADFVKLAKDQKGGLYEKVITYSPQESLRDGNATKNAILDGLDWIGKVVTNNDVAMIFLAGHGIKTPDQHYRFLPYDYDPGHVVRTTISDSELRDYLTEIGGKKIFFFDTCHSGAVLGGRAVDTQPDVDKFANDLRAAENGIVVFTSSTGSELSQERPEWMHGAFTLAVLEGLRGQAARPDIPVVMISDLQGYVSQRVQRLTGGNQKPMMAMPKTVEDYPISMRLQ